MKTLIIDSNYLCYRAFHSVGDLEYDELQTGVMFGFLNSVFELGRRFQTNKFVFCFDLATNNRKKMYPKYKQKRTEDLSDEDKEKKRVLYNQIFLLRKKILPKMGFTNILSEEGFESDDIMASLVMMKTKRKFIIISADNDLFQLLDHCSMYSLNTKKLYTKKTFKEEWKLPPYKWAEIKAIAGCKSDNVAGIVGVKEITAAKYLRNELKDHTKVFKAIEAGSKVIKRNRKLVKLPLPGTPTYKLQKNDFRLDAFLKICNKCGFESFLKKERLDFIKDFFRGDF